MSWYARRAMPKKAKPAFGAKAAFVRNNPTVPAQEVVELAKKHGLQLTVGHVYNIRAEDKRKRGVAEQAAAPSAPQAAASSSGDGGPLEAQLRTLVIRMGLDRADRVFTELKSSLSRLH